MELKNVNENKNIISLVKENSIAEELGVEKGDRLLTINDNAIKDIIDYKFHIADDFLTMKIMKSDGDVWQLEIEKDFDEDIGIIFSNPLIDKAKSCNNKCVFCFVDQLPKGMRKTLYFKDDDSRLSFLQGNFITLTNMSEEDIRRIIKFRISPINISVHTTDPELRTKMLNNKKAGRVYEIMKRFNEAGITMNCQIVLCPGINDKENLNNTIKDLRKLYPSVRSVAIVPVGLTKHREGLAKLKEYDYKKAKELLERLNNLQSLYLDEIGTKFVYASDEFYILAQKKIPKYEEYENFPQLENGVGLLRKFKDEVCRELNNMKAINTNKKLTLVTGFLASDFIKDIAKEIMKKVKGLTLEVKPIKNMYFGETITVSGLITGQDIINQLKSIDIGDGIILPNSMLRANEDIFLDDITVKDIENKLNTKVIKSEVNGKEFLKNIITNAR
ncbi:MAG: DUF512 domain-containing protein [Firmicutes bacterium]|nr:DUF512 domain-containing protein [Bacillota bacterium]